jgi:hypothetical protein
MFNKQVKAGRLSCCEDRLPSSHLMHLATETDAMVAWFTKNLIKLFHATHDLTRLEVLIVLLWIYLGL